MTILQSGAIASTGGGYQIERSLRFNSADSAYLNRTVGSAATSNTLTTFSFWFKRSKLSTSQIIFSTNESSNVACYIELTTSDTLRIYLDKTAASSDETSWVTTAVFRDVSAWYHATIKIDASQASNSDKVVLYINNVIQTLTATQTGTAVSTQRILANGASLAIGKYTTAAYYGDFYLTEFYAIDGQALTPSSFGETDTNTGVWKPKAYSGTYGTNGFYLKFADNSGTTSTTLGKDSSGNGNNWTPNNFSVTAGVGNDSLVDSPTSYGTDTGVGGTVRGNYATYNSAGSAPSVTLTNGNLDASHGAFSSTTGAASTFGVSSGKWYWEVTINTISSGAPFIGIVRSDQLYPFTTLFANNSQGYAYRSTGVKRNNSTDTSYGASYTSGDVIGVALDMDAGTIVFYKNNSSQGTAFSSLSGTFIPIDANGTSGGTYTSTINFGQRAFAYTAPSGFKALCTQNLPTPTIGATSTTQANDYMNVVLYSGNSSTQAITGVGFQPDFVWCKGRSTGGHHIVTDAVRTAAKVLSTSQTAAESAWSDNAFFQSLNSDGFTLSGGGTGINTTGNTYVAWNWKANGAGSSNTAGTITSTVSANTTSGFSIVTYTGTGANATVGHGLGVAPSMIIIKARTGAVRVWPVYHVSRGPGGYGYLNQTNAWNSDTTGFNNTNPTSTVFSLGNNTDLNDGSNFVAYCFAPVAGYSAFGSYTGNNSDDGPFIFTNFRPAFVLIKATNTTQWWTLLDSKRDTYNVSTLGISPNSSDAESTFNTNRGPHNIDFTSNGFKIRTSSSGINGTNTFIYAAFAETPAKFSLAR